jgi:putative tricarboxylic transport membrane protein
MAWREVASAAALVLVALVALLSAARLEVGSLTRPGPGFFPVVLATALLLVSLTLLGRAWASRDATPSAAGEALARRPWALGATVGALALYVALFERLGFVLGTAGLLTFLFGAVARYRWPVAAGTAVGLALVARLVFDRWLQVRLPPDFWGR